MEERALTTRFDPLTTKMLDQMAKHQNVSLSEIVRKAVTHYYMTRSYKVERPQLHED